MTFLRSYHRPAMKRRLIAGIIPPWLANHRRAGYIHSAILSFPFWVSREELKRIDEEAQRLSRSTGVPHEVDHIVPIRHPRVCGLTVPWNLQILTQQKNGQKGNQWHEAEAAHEQLELFPLLPAEQFSLPIA